MRIIVVGPTGGTGRLLLEKGIRAGHAVTAFTRGDSTIAQQPGLRVLIGGVFDVSAVEAAMQGYDAVLSALGGRLSRATVPAPLFLI